MKPFIALVAAALSSITAAAPLTLLKDINRTLNVEASGARAAPILGGAVLTLCTDNFGCDPWFTDGTSANTRPLRRSGSSQLRGYASFGGSVYFTDGQLLSLWKTDGTAAGTVPVASVPAVTTGAGAMVVANGTLFFQGYDSGRNEATIWRSDGSASGTYALAQTAAFTDLVVLGDRALFPCATTAGQELCISAGTAATTAVVKDINPGSGGSSPHSMVVVGTRLFFMAYDGSTTALWSSDGTDAGTIPVANMPTGTPSRVVAHQGAAYFVVGQSDGHLALWKTDGFATSFVDIVGNVPGQFDPPVELVSTGAYIYVSAGTQLWRSDGSAGSVVHVAPELEPATFRTLSVLGGDLYFTRYATADGATERVLASGSTTAQQAGITFDADFPGVVNGVALAAAGQAWARDPVSGWQRLLAAPDAPSNSSQCGRGAAAVGNAFVFAANDGIHGCSVWRSDGTTPGTFLVKSVPVDTDTSFFTYPSFTTVGVYVYFSSRSLNTLWRTDGTDAGTVAVDGVYPSRGVIAALGETAIVASEWGTWSVPPPPAAPVQLLSMSSGMSTSTFTAAVATGRFALVNWPIRTTSSGVYTGLYRTDGTIAGTSLLLDPGSDTITQVVASDSVALFVRRPPFGNSQLWRTDGTAAGTYQLPAPADFSLVSRPANGRFVLIAQHATWITDGTSAGTFPVAAQGSLPFANDADGTVAWGIGAASEWSDGFAARVFDLPFGSVWGHAAARSSLFLSMEDGSVPRLWASGGTTAGTVLAEGAGNVTGHKDNDAGPYATAAGILYFGDTNGSGWEPHLLPFDSTPDPLAIPAASNALPGHLVTSAGAQVTGINVPVPVVAPAGSRVCVSSTSACACDVQPMSNSVMANVGQYLCVEQTASMVPGASVSTSITVAGQAATFTATTTTETNYALRANGGRVLASSEYSALYPVRALNNNERAGIGLGLGDAGGTGGTWIDGTTDLFPDVVEVDFNGVKAIDRVAIYTLQDDLVSPVEPGDAMTFSQYGVTSFTLQGWSGTAWQTLATVSGNNFVKRTLAFAPFTTTKIRITITGALGGRSRLAEIEAWGTDSTWAFPWSRNVALASLGTTVAASSQLSDAFAASGAIDGDPIGERWTNGGGWADATQNQYPDWLEVDFSAPQPISEVVVYTVQDDWQNPRPPTDTMTFTQYGTTDFTVQGWDGAQWVTLATVTNNTHVKRTVFLQAPFTTSKLRVNITGAMAAYSRITEVEAWIVNGGSTPANVALASNGATATASSQFGSGFPVAAVINGDTTGAGWTNGGGWADGTQAQYPDWVEVDFAQPSQIDHVVVSTLQDNWQSPVQPTDTMTFTQYGVTAFDVQVWDGGAWRTVASVTGNNLVKRTVPFDAVATSKVRVVVNASLNSLSRIVEIEAWTGSSILPTNMALASAGGIASASSQLSADFPVSAIINGERAGANWSHGGGWADATPGQLPDWVQIDFNGQKSLTSVVVYTLQDSWQNPSEPTDSMTFTQYGVTDFTVQGWDGTQWVTLGTVTGNNLVKRTVTFSAFTTTKIRVNVTGALNTYSRIMEVEAWGTPAGPTSTNVALASNGAVALASSQLNGNFPVSAVINGDRKGMNWTAGGGWADGTLDAYPDWVEIDFNGAKTLSQVNVYTLQDNWQNPSEPTDAMTFTQYGITDFTVQAWDGSAWQTVGTASGNNLVKRTFNVSVTTTKIRVNVTHAMASLSRITEIEAIGS